MLFESEEQKRLRRDAYAGLVQMLKEAWREDRPAFWRGMLGILMVIIGSVAFLIDTLPAKIVAGAALGAWVGILATQYSRKKD
ncbi:MAG: hypothetical protein ACYCVT_09340 [Acidithiobacillus ferrooxidans]